MSREMAPALGYAARVANLCECVHAAPLSPRICEWPPSIIHPPSPTSMLVCSRHRTTVAAHILDAVSAWPPRAPPSLAACPSSSARNRLCKSAWRATAELSGGCPPGEAWMEPALNCIETGMATACAERGSEQRAECESVIRCNERRRHPVTYEASPLSAWQGARRRSHASRSHRRRSGEDEGPTAGRNAKVLCALGFRSSFRISFGPVRLSFPKNLKNS